jgi:hypothetical protein
MVTACSGGRECHVAAVSMASASIAVEHRSRRHRTRDRHLDHPDVRHPEHQHDVRVDVVRRADPLRCDHVGGGQFRVRRVVAAEDVERLPERPGVLRADELGHISDRSVADDVRRGGGGGGHRALISIRARSSG